MKKLVLALVACLGLAGCADEYVAPVAASPANCFVVTDEFGEREVCNTQYYYTNGGVIYWDSHFGVWVSPWGYYHGGVWTHGYYPGWHSYYGPGFYHARGYFHGGYRGGNFHGGYRGGSFRGGGGGHFGGGHR